MATVYQTQYPGLGEEKYRERLMERPDYQLYKSLPVPRLSREEFERLSMEQCSGFEKTMYQHLMQHYLSIRSPYRSLLLFHGLGVGKCHARDTPILMYDGTIKMVQDVRIGDLLMGDDSTPRRVLSLTTGEDALYDIVPVKGEPYRVNSEHILCLKQSPCAEDSDTMEIAVKDYLVLSEAAKSSLWGYRTGVEFKEQPLPIDPYQFGQWLGEAKSVSHDVKRIPPEFLYNSRENRQKLLAGLVDTAGRLIQDSYEIPHVSESMAEEILYLARSLGLAAYKHPRHICISGDIYRIPVTLEHKKAYLRQPGQEPCLDVLRTSVDVRPVGRGAYYGFILDGNHRYLLGDFTVTHNSCSSITIAEAMLKDHRAGDEPSIIVISTGTLKKSYEGQIFSISQTASLEALREQCTGDYYARLVGKLKVPATEKEKNELQRDVEAKISQRYEFHTYQNFAKQLERLSKKGELDTIHDKVIIIDEAHNLRDVSKEESTGQQKALTQPLIDLLREGKNNRLVLLSATPMYNEPDEILWLLSLLCLNDKRLDILDPDHLPSLFRNGKLSSSMAQKLSSLASEYISYIRGNNPFTFPIRISPRLLGVPVLSTSVTDKDMTDPAWPTYYLDGLVPTPLGSMQREDIQNKTIHDTRERMKIFEQMNCIVYKGETGDKWIEKMFDVNVTPTLSYRYKGSKPTFWLSPTKELLGSIACKIQRICEFIKSSTGIVVVYSNFNYSGVIPLALALEHVGFGRYGGRNLLEGRKPTNLEPYTYHGISTPNYVILSGKDEIMKGGKTISNLLEYVNSPQNLDGKRVKVVILTPIAREGLTIKNVREIHIMTPWYNINSLEQVIGRVIRTCSHIKKPLEERNVTVYCHTTTNTDSKGKPIDTADLKSYRISARKLTQTHQITNILRDHAWDCSLMKNLNYIPREVFDFTVQMRTSQGGTLEYHYGDSETDKPRCPDLPSLHKKDPIRPDVYADIIPTIQARLRKHIRAKMDTPDQTVIVPLKDLPMILRLQEFPEVVTSTIRASLEKEGLISGHRVFIHKDSLYVTPMLTPKKGSQVRIMIKEQKPEQVPSQEIDIFGNIDSIPDDDDAILYVYNILHANTWPKLAYHLIVDDPDPDPDEDPTSDHKPGSSWKVRLAKLLYRQGALIHGSEYASWTGKKRKYIGYYNFFEKPEKAYILSERGILIHQKEVKDAIQNRRKQISIPTDKAKDYMGFYVPHEGNMVFKILVKGQTIRKTDPGTQCKFLSVPDLETMWDSLKITTERKPSVKEDICNRLSRILMAKDRMILPPSYKPKP